MANWTGGRLTKAGRDLQLKIEAGRCKLEITKIKLGDGTEDIASADGMTDLASPKMVFGVSGVEIRDERCTVTGVIDTSNVSESFYAREWGLFALDPDIGEILYLISIDSDPDKLTPTSTTFRQSAAYTMNIAVSNAEQITVRIDPNGLVTVSMMNQSVAAHNSDPAAHPHILQLIEQLKLRYGAPLVAATAAEMADAARVYVYVGNEAGYRKGYWYYYDGAAWAEGGIYNETALETDKTLTTSDYAADAKAVGDRFARGEAQAAAHIARIDAVDDAQNDAIRNLQSADTALMQRLQSTAEDIHTKLALSVELKDSYLMDGIGNYITDEAGNRILSQVYLPVTDATLTAAGVPADAAAVRAQIGSTFASQYEQYPIPLLYLYDDGSMAQLVSKASGTLKRSVAYSFPSFGIRGTLARVKVQGSSSQAYPKKNYTLTFERPVDFGWGAQKKYVIKANWVDFSHVRNVVCARLWGDVRRTRIASNDLVTDQNGNYITDQQGNRILTEASPMLSAGLNYGAIDGFPIAVALNGTYWGLYSLTIPKDGWMAKMGHGKYEAIVSADLYSASTYFRALAAIDAGGNLAGQDFSVEYCADENNQAWIAASLNRMIQAVMDSTGARYADTCGAYVDIDSAVDYMIFNCLINNTDGLGKNYLLDTFDGRKWYFVAYDMDGVLGNIWHGMGYFRADGDCTFAGFEREHRMMHLIYAYDRTRLCARYRQLRSGPLSEEAVTYKLMNYAVNIPKANRDYEVLRWPGIPGTDTNNVSQMLHWYRLRCIALDAEITALESTL